MRALKCNLCFFLQRGSQKNHKISSECVDNWPLRVCCKCLRINTIWARPGISAIHHSFKLKDYLLLCLYVEGLMTPQAVFFMCQENVLCRDVKDTLLSDVLIRIGSLPATNQESEIEFELLSFNLKIQI